ncbi:MAG: 1-acyl-sn-glycerol-3-phosphate acyltransferase [Bacteroidales bacterium]|nr:1-acyl-sn-glycerol-3-phosphate acyltransferase [Bacteroidales bacterium]
MTKHIINIYRFLKKHKWLRRVGLISLILFLGYFALHLSLEEDIAGFMPSDESNERINYVYKNIGIAEKTIIKFSYDDSVSNESKNMLIEAADSFATYLNSITVDKNLVKEVFYKIDQQKIFELTDFLTSNAVYYLEDSDYEYIESILNPDSISLILENNKKLLISPAGMVLKNHIMADPLHFTTGALSRLKSLQVSKQYNLYNDYIFSSDETCLFMFITSENPVSETNLNEDLVNCIEKSVNHVLGNYDIDITYFSPADVAVTNAKRIKRDSYLSIIIAVILILSLLLWFFRSIKSILLIAVPVVFGAIMALAALFFIKGTISAIAIGAGSIIFGIALNYSLHYLIHAKHGINPQNVLKDIASPMIVGSITTVSAFLSLLFISAESMRDFGLFAAFTLTGTLIFVIVFLPHITTNSGKEFSNKHLEFIDKISSYRLDKNKWVLWLIAVLTPLFIYFSFDVSFESEMNKINYMTKDQKESFNRLSNFTSLGEKSMYLIADDTGLDAAIEQYEGLKTQIDSLVNKGVVTNVAGIGSFLPSAKMQEQKINRWNEFWHNRRDILMNLLLQQGTELGFKEEAFDKFKKMLYADYNIEQVEYFEIITENYLKDYLITKENRAMVITLLNVSPENSDIVSQVLTKDKSFVFDSGSIAQSLVNTLKNDFNKVLYICSFLVLLFLTLSFGRLELSLIAFLPMLISWLWILGLMAVFNISFNIVNIILATFIFGLGDDYTIFMMEGAMSEYSTSRKLLTSYKTAVALSSITMFIGIGTLVFAKHPAMRSLADVTIIGMFSVVLMSFVIPPLLFSIITNKNGKKRLIPVTFINFFATLYSFIVFLIGSFFLNTYGFFLFNFGGKTKKNKFRYHKAINAVTTLVANNIPMVEYELKNTANEDFSKPGIIISNHQSHIDLMFILSLSPKVVILTNEWVWKSPFYGRLVKYADFYPVANGVENSLDKLKALIDDGYSIMIFPEGTRSEDCSILRFKKGAFYLAEKFNLDIIPVVTHGIGHALPKKEMLLRKGKVTVQILDRIEPNDFSFGKDYSQRSKNIRKLYKKEYKKLANINETASYYKSLVIHNYIYKGPIIEWETRQILKKYNNFEPIINILPNKGQVLIPNCNYGVFSLICALVKKDLLIIASDKSIDKLDIARNCISIPKNLTYIDYNESEIIQDYNAIVLQNTDIKEFEEYCVKYYASTVYMISDISDINVLISDKIKIVNCKNFNIVIRAVNE